MSFAFEGPLVTSPTICHELPLSVLRGTRSQRISFAAECLAMMLLYEVMRFVLLPELVLQLAK